jgi:hypothetical protein
VLYNMKIAVKAFVLITVLIISYPVFVSAQSTVTLSPSNLIVSSLGKVSIQVNVGSVINLHSASVTISFDSTILRYSSITSGTFLQSNSMGYSVFMGKTFYPNSVSPNQVKVDQAILGNASVTGSGLIFTINFNANNAGITPVTISAFTLIDINNNVISATAQSGSVTLSLNMSPKIFLQGFYNGTVLNTTLNSKGLLPLSQPYSISPWNYTGTESVTSGFFGSHPSIVDWVLVELRTGTGSATSVGKRAAFLLTNGNITDIDGVSPVSFSGPVAGSYYLVVKHRNHCSVMSAGSIPLNLAASAYNFTSALSQGYGVNPMKDLGGGYFGLWAGDTNSDGVVDLSDLILIDNDNTTFIVGYVKSDLNGDGTVDLTDLIPADNNNSLFAGSGVPPVSK